MVQAPHIIIVEVSGQPSLPYNLGNWTYISKPVSPVKINSSQIPIGANWTYVYALNENCTYHVYCYGEWIDYRPDSNKTDYDIFVYNPLGELEGYHTEAAGLPEHLGTTVDEPFFVPRHSGNYSFLIKNDPRESQASKEATFMLIEHIDCNKWYQRYLEGKVDDKPVENTSWAYEFNTTSKHIEVAIEVPDTLDMYEARLYVMANPAKGMGVLLNGMPLAWEPGLYGLRSSIYGGYNLDSEGFRHSDAFASCEYPGQDMLINYTSSEEGNVLYHLVFIAEHGVGVINFNVKTDFEAPILRIRDPIEGAYPYNETSITAYVTDAGSGLREVILNYTVDDWATWSSIEMAPSQNQTYVGIVPGQPAGTTVQYRIVAFDVANNKTEIEGSYVVKNPTRINFSLSKSAILGGESINVTGLISHGGAAVTLNYTCGNFTVTRQVSANSSGFFEDVYTPNKVGLWTALAYWLGNETCFEAFSGYENFTVEKASMSIILHLENEKITIGENVTVNGLVEPGFENLTVTLIFTKPDGSNFTRNVYTSSNGNFTFVFQPEAVGTWLIQAKFGGDDLRYGAQSDSKSLLVNDTWINRYKLYIIIPFGVVTPVLAAVVYIRKRR
jgi:hypothetical protein